MTDQLAYQSTAPYLALIESILDDNPGGKPAAPLRSLRGFEREVSCLLEAAPATSSPEAS